MLRKLVLCLSFACLTRAAYIRSRAGPVSPGDEKKPMTPKDLAEGVKEAQNKVMDLRTNVNDLIVKVIKGDKTDQDWFEIMKHMADFMQGGFGLFMESLQDVTQVAEHMFEGDHGFKKVGRCSSLAESVEDPDFGKPEFVSRIELAMSMDLLCFDNMLKELTVLKFSTNPGCAPSEDDVIDFVSDTLKDLFRLRNDGERFFNAVSKATEEYSDKIPSLMNGVSSTDLVKQLVRALQNQ